jgi:DNA-binding NarL/FixJ family response regulator
VGSEGWPLVCGQEHIGTIANAILSHVGAVVRGESGVGKTALVRRALAGIGGQIAVFPIRGKNGPTPLPYSALYPLTSQLGAEHAQEPSLLLHGLAGLISSQAKGATAVLYVDHCESLDSGSATLVSQLVDTGTVVLLAVCTDNHPMNPEARSLCHDERFIKVRLERMSFKCARELLAAGLGAPVSRAAAYELWKCSGGNQRVLKSLALEWSGSGCLRETSGGWVLTETAAPLSPEVFELWRARLATLNKGQRAVVELVALSESIPLSLLLELTDPADVDVVHDLGLLEVGPEHPACVQMNDALGAMVVRSSVPPGRSRTLLAGLTELAGETLPQAINPMALASWRLSSGSNLDFPDALAAAEHANKVPDGRAAMRFLSAVKERHDDPRFVNQMLRAMIHEGHYDEAEQLLAEHLKLVGEPPLLEDAARLQLVQAKLMRLGTGGGSQGPAPASDYSYRFLEELYGRLTAEHANAEPESDDRHDVFLEVRQSLIEAAVHAGYYRDVLDLCAEEPLANSGPQHWGIANRMHEALVIAGSMDEGISKAMDLVSKVKRKQAEPAVEAAVRDNVFNLSLISGRLDICAEMLAESGARGGYTEAGMLDEALFYVMSGRPDEALNLLGPETYQLLERDPHGVLQLALAASAYAHMLAGNHQEADALLTELASHTAPSSWKAARLALVFSSLATASGDAPAGSRRRLIDAAEEDIARGNLLLALWELTAAVRMDQPDSAVRLGDAAAQADGRFAALCEAYAKAVSEGDPQRLLDAAKEAASMGQHPFAADAAAQATRTAYSTGDNTAAAEARAFRPRASTGGQGVDDILGAAGLTPRQRIIAKRAAAGKSNREIAEDLHLSIRTVEGHLYQIYSRLNLANRYELQRIVR